MKNFKKLSRTGLKKVKGANAPKECLDMCSSHSDCTPYGLACGIYIMSNGAMCTRCL